MWVRILYVVDTARVSIPRLYLLIRGKAKNMRVGRRLRIPVWLISPSSVCTEGVQDLVKAIKVQEDECRRMEGVWEEEIVGGIMGSR
jgi:hypothetical protein